MEKEEITQLLQRLADELYISKQVFTVSDLAKYTGYSKSFIYKACASRELPHSSPRYGRIFFDRDAINAWLLSNPIPTKSEIQRQANNYK